MPKHTSAKQHQSRREHPAAVYLIQRRDRRRFKLGTSIHPLDRAKVLPEYRAGELDLSASLVLWLPSTSRAAQIERGMHKCLAPFSASPGHHGNGYSEWFSPPAYMPAVRLLQRVPRDHRGASLLGLRPIIFEDAPPTSAYRTPQDAWWTLEDLLLRASQILPVEAKFSGETWTLALGCFRGAWDGEMAEIRPRLVDLETYAWKLDSGSGSFIQLLQYVGDTLQLSFTARSLIQRWPEGQNIELQLRALGLRFTLSSDQPGAFAHV